MPTTSRVENGSQTKGTKAVVIYPTEYSGSNAVDRYLQGVECKTYESVYKYLAIKPQPINDALRVRDGRVLAQNSLFDDAEQETILRREDNNRVAVIFGSNTKSGVRSVINHAFDRRDLGQGIFRHHDGTPYGDNVSGHPVDVMNALDNNISFTQFSLDEHGFESGDAYLDPLAARPIARNVLVMTPFYANGIKADISVTDNTGKSIQIFQQIEKNSARTIILSGTRPGRFTRDVYLAGTDHYVDGVCFFSNGLLGSLPGTKPLHVDGFVNPDRSEIIYFLDGEDIEISPAQITDSPDEIMKEALLELSPALEDDLFGRNHVSCNAGFVYNNCSCGTDSLAYGGLLR